MKGEAKMIRAAPKKSAGKIPTDFVKNNLTAATVYELILQKIMM